MIDLERFAVLLDEQVALLPAALFNRLNLGVSVAEQAKRESRARPGLPVYILGEYHRHPVMGRGVVLYYGSFRNVYGHLPEEALRLEIDRVLRHELTHHLESMAGDRDLEREDARRLQSWNSGEGEG
ncbi:MAG: hypothetical protein GX650_08675 [Clostridiales bacterium]|nr:hypothetical protein [Clostridiales bacterium]